MLVPTYFSVHSTHALITCPTFHFHPTSFHCPSLSLIPDFCLPSAIYPSFSLYPPISLPASLLLCLSLASHLAYSHLSSNLSPPISILPSLLSPPIFLPSSLLPSLLLFSFFPLSSHFPHLSFHHSSSPSPFHSLSSNISVFSHLYLPHSFFLSF